MFDDQFATVEVFRAGKALGIPIWGHRWTEMPGGACAFEGGRWVRCDDEGNVLPDQMQLPLAAE
ncbi:hypothetical protein [Methylobacterium oxalidis]|uniref:hypothetical protein n=1 Tax=Methylobacterium oxalidis TaxID=944322 RepID=UPI003314811D